MDATIELPLNGKVALVTGAAGGLGSALSRALAARGATVAACDIATDRLADLVTGTEGIDPYHIDLTDPEDIQRCLAEVTRSHGDVDVLVHAAIRHVIGDDGRELRDFADHTPEQVIETLAVAVTGPTLLTQLVVKRMAARRTGRIVLTGSMHHNGTAGLVMYAAAKSYINALARGLFLELRDYDVLTLVANPGGMHTQMHDHRYPWMLDPALVAEVIVGQILLPRDVALLSFEMVPHDVHHPDGF